MPRKARVERLANGISRDGQTLLIRATVNHVPLVERVPLDTPLHEAILARKRMILRAEAEGPAPIPSGTLAADIPRALALWEHLQDYRQRKAHLLLHWAPRLGHLRRSKITSQDILAARVAWLKAGAAPKTVNNRVDTLRALYHVLDGMRATTPCDDIKRLEPPKAPPQFVSDETILRVEAELQRREANPRVPLWTAKTRARFRVLVTTGKRPSELMRAQPSDVDLDRRVWRVRNGKGGWSPGVYLNDDMLAAWRLFIEAHAWGKYNTGSLADTIREAGWPADVRPYNARHSTWITAVERGADMADVQIGAGHTSIATTRRHYTGVRNSRMQKLSEMLDGRFSGFPTVETWTKPRRTARALRMVKSA